MAKITIIGAGMMGTALCWPLADNGHQINLVGTHLDSEYIQSICDTRIHPKIQRGVPAAVEPYFHTQIPLALEGADLVVSGVSSFGVAWFAEQAGPYLREETPIIAVTKGLEDLPNGDLRILPDALNAYLPEEKRDRLSLNAIGGPCISHELAARRHTGAVFCGPDLNILKQIRSLFQTAYYHVWTTTDMIGVEACAALKNGYAMGVSLAAGEYELKGQDVLAHMYNPQAALFAQSTWEMSLLLKLMGGKLENDYALPGAGDLYVTVFGGRTARLGRMLGKGISYAEARQALAGETLEAVEIISSVARALPKLEARGLARAADFPLLNHMNAVLNEGAVVNIPWDRFFTHYAVQAGG